MSASERLADDAENQRRNREGKAATAAALRHLLRNGTSGANVPAALVDALKARHDGTQIRLTATDENDQAPGRAGTNYANDITHAVTPLETTREDQ